LATWTTVRFIPLLWGLYGKPWDSLWYLNGCKYDENNPSFFVLGDDVVILDNQLHQKYLEILESWGCPWSPEKTISSDCICEFAGKVITREGSTSQYKWREMSDDNFVDICRQMGPRSRALLSSDQKKVFDLIKHCSLPLGLNFSYLGSNLEKMEQESDRVFGRKAMTVLDSLVDRHSIIHKNLYGSEGSRIVPAEALIREDVVAEQERTFDEKVRKVLRRVLSWLISPNQSVRLVSGVPGALGLTDLPLGSLPPSRETTLDRYMRFIPHTP